MRAKGLGGTGGGFDFKSLEFENGFEGQQDGEIVVDEKNATFHVHLLSGSWRCSALRNRLAAVFMWRSRFGDHVSFSRSIHSFSIGAWPAST